MTPAGGNVEGDRAEGMIKGRNKRPPVPPPDGGGGAEPRLAPAGLAIGRWKKVIERTPPNNDSPADRMNAGRFRP